jgi:hypothetical protein
MFPKNGQHVSKDSPKPLSDGKRGVNHAFSIGMTVLSSLKALVRT